MLETSILHHQFKNNTHFVVVVGIIVDVFLVVQKSSDCDSCQMKSNTFEIRNVDAKEIDQCQKPVYTYTYTSICISKYISDSNVDLTRDEQLESLESIIIWNWYIYQAILDSRLPIDLLLYR